MDASTGYSKPKSPKAEIFDDSGLTESRHRAASPLNFLYSVPWWLLVLILIGIAVIVLVTTDPVFTKIFDQLKEGVGMTLRVSFIAYLSALMIGLVIGLIRSNAPSAPPHGAGILRVISSVVRLAVYNAATFYVQMLRGLPILVVLLIVAFVVVPLIKDLLAGIGVDISGWRGASWESAAIALALAYGAFLSETLRAGIQSIGKGQVEAARSLGMNYYTTMRYIVLPQAIRRVLPPLGNDMIAMIKDSSLVAILGVGDITQIARTSVGRSFRYMETYLVVAAIYLTMTVIGSLLVRTLERYLKQNEA